MDKIHQSEREKTHENNNCTLMHSFETTTITTTITTTLPPSGTQSLMEFLKMYFNMPKDTQN